VLGERADGPAKQATRAALEIQGMTSNAAAYQGKSFGVSLNGVTTNVNLPATVGSTSSIAKIEKSLIGEDQGAATSIVLGNQPFKAQTVDMSSAAKRVFDIRVGDGSYVSVDITNALSEELGVGINELNAPGSFAASHSDEVTQKQFVKVVNAALEAAGVNATASVDKHGMVKFAANDGGSISMRAGATQSGVAGTFLSSFVQTGMTAPINAVDLTTHSKTGFRLAVNGNPAVNVEFSDLLDNPAYVKDRAGVTSSELQNVLQTKLDTLFTGDNAIKVNIDDEGFINLNVQGGNRTVTISETGLMANGITLASTGGATLFGAGTIDNNDVTKNIETTGILQVATPLQQKNLVMTVSVNAQDPVHIDMTSYLRSNVNDLQAATGDEIASALQAAFNDKFTGENAVSVKLGGDGKLSFAVAGGQQYLKVENYTPADGSGAGNFVTTFIKSTALEMNSNIRSTADYKGSVAYSDSRGTNATALFSNPFSEYQAYTANATNLKPFSDQNVPTQTITLSAGTIEKDDTIDVEIDGTTVSYTVTADDVADTTLATFANNISSAINANSTLHDKVLATAGNGKIITIANMTGAAIATASTSTYNAAGAATQTGGTVAAWSTSVASGAGLAVTAATNDTLSLTVGSTSSSVTISAGTYSTIDALASEINLQIEKSGMFQGDNAIKAVVYTGNDVFHADQPADVNKYLVLESAGGKQVTIDGTFVTAGTKFFGTERNTEINSTRILSSLGMPWNNLQTANKVDGGVDTTAGNGIISVTIANGSSSITKQVSLGNQSATRSFSDFSNDLGSAINAAFSADGYSVNTSFEGGKLSVTLGQQGPNTITLGGAIIQDAFGSATVSASGVTGEEATLTSMSDVAAAINEDLTAANAGVKASFDAATGKLKFEATAGATGPSSTVILSGSDLSGLQFGNNLTATGSAGNATNARISDITVLSTGCD